MPLKPVSVLEAEATRDYFPVAVLINLAECTFDSCWASYCEFTTYALSEDIAAADRGTDHWCVELLQQLAKGRKITDWRKV